MPGYRGNYPPGQPGGGRAVGYTKHDPKAKSRKAVTESPHGLTERATLSLLEKQEPHMEIVGGIQILKDEVVK